MTSSFQIARFGSTAIRVHISMLLVIPYVWFQFKPDSLNAYLYSLGLILALFACILLHELGHTWAARRFGIGVSSIMLWPLGGIANLSRTPEKPRDQLWISAAGPLVNLLLAALLGLWTFGWITWLTRTDYWWEAAAYDRLVISLPFNLAISNLALALFNLVPLYPLDGGQIARAGLHLLLGQRRADRLTLLIAIPLAAGLIGLGIHFRDPLLVGLSLLLLLGASTLSQRLLRWLSLGISALFDRGSYYRMREDYDQAIRHYSRGIQRYPHHPGGYTRRAVVYMNLQELELAREDVEHALTLDPNNVLAITLRGELLSLEQQPDTALACFNRAIELKPDWYAPYIDRGSTFLDRGEVDQALADLNRAIELNSWAPTAYLTRSLARFRRGDRDGALADATLAVQQSPQNGLVLPEFFLSAFEGHLDWAEAYYAQALYLLPNSALPYQGRADAYRANGQLEAAVADYEQAILRSPTRPGPYLGRGLAYQRLGDLKQAAADFRQALRRAKKSHLKRQAQELLEAVNPPALQRFITVTEGPARPGSRRMKKQR